MAWGQALVLKKGLGPSPNPFRKELKCVTPCYKGLKPKLKPEKGLSLFGPCLIRMLCLRSVYLSIFSRVCQMVSTLSI